MPKKPKGKQDAWPVHCVNDGHFLGEAFITNGIAKFYCKYCKQFTIVASWPHQQGVKRQHPGKT